MSNPTSNTCPVCGATLTDGICQTCGWIEIVFPAEIPAKLRQANELRLAAMQATFKKRDEAQKKAERLGNELATTSKELTQARTTIGEQSQKLIALEQTSNMNIAGMVVVCDKKRDKKACCPIFQGINTYGSDPSLDMHHKIKLITFDQSFMPKHFSVETTDDHLLLKDLSNGSLGIDDRGIYAEGKKVKYGDNIEIEIYKS